jgi:SAM-dependent methyltransferase
LITAPDRHGTVVLVTLDDAASLAPVLAELHEATSLLATSGITFDLVLVDRGSTDHTVEVARAEAGRLGIPIDVLRAPLTEGWAATSIGLRHAIDRHRSRLDLLVTLDPDGHHDARQLPDLARRCLARGSGITIGSRWTRGGSAPGTPLARRLLSRAASMLVGVATGVPGVRDITTSFRVIRPDVVELVGHDRAAVGTYGFYAEFVAVARALGFSVDEVPITFRPRYSGVDALTGRDLVEFARDLLRIRHRVRHVRDTMRHDQTVWASRSGRMRGQAATTDAEFGALDELETLSDAENFTDWIVDQFEPHLDGNVLEVGAGLGSVSRRIAQRHPSASVTALEPAANVFDRLRTDTAETPGVRAHRMTSAEWLAAGSSAGHDTVLYVNVLEHIRDDADELRTAFELVRPGGVVGLFVPALPRLYGSLDHKSGHYRRYRRQGLEQIVTAAGFQIERIHHLDVLGIAPYWLMYRLFDRQRLDRASSGLYDRVLVPIARATEQLVGHPPVGKNLVVVARRPPASRDSSPSCA